MACDLGAADWGQAFNSHRGCVLGPGHTAAPLVSQGGSSIHLFAGHHGGWEGKSRWRRPSRQKGWGLVSGDSPGWGRLKEPRGRPLRRDGVPSEGFGAPELLPALLPGLSSLPPPRREGQGPLEILQLDFEMENFTSQSVKRRIMWHIDYRGHGALPDLERAVTELTVIQRDVQAILPLAMVSCPRRRQASSVPGAGVGQWLLRGTEVRDVTMGGFLEEVSLQWRLEGLMEEELTQRR